MRDLPVPVEEWRKIINGAHNISVISRVLDPLDLDRILYFGLPATAGQITQDASAAVRRTLDLTLVDDDGRYADAAGRITPGEPGDLFAPYGSLIAVQYGVEIPGYHGFFGDQMFYLEQGLFRISSTEVTGDGTVKISAADLSRQVARSTPVVPLVYAPGSNYATVIVDVVAGGLPAPLAARVCGDLATITPTTHTTPLIVVDAKADRWAEARKMARAIGYNLFFGANFGLQLVPVIDPAGQPPTARLVEGETALITVRRNLSDDPGYNGVILDAEATTLPAPIRSIAWDTDPDSPTYYLGGYGQRPKPITSAYVATQAQGDAAARAELLRMVLGVTERVQASTLPDPALETDDLAQVLRGRSGVDGQYVPDVIELPLMYDEAMTLTLRPRRAPLEEDG